MGKETRNKIYYRGRQVAFAIVLRRGTMKCGGKERGEFEEEVVWWSSCDGCYYFVRRVDF